MVIVRAGERDDRKWYLCKVIVVGPKEWTTVFAPFVKYGNRAHTFQIVNLPARTSAVSNRLVCAVSIKSERHRVGSKKSHVDVVGIKWPKWRNASAVNEDVIVENNNTRCSLLRVATELANRIFNA